MNRIKIELRFAAAHWQSGASLSSNYLKEPPAGLSDPSTLATNAFHTPKKLTFIGSDHNLHLQ